MRCRHVICALLRGQLDLLRRSNPHQIRKVLHEAEKAAAAAAYLAPRLAIGVAVFMADLYVGPIPNHWARFSEVLPSGSRDEALAAEAFYNKCAFVMLNAGPLPQAFVRTMNCLGAAVALIAGVTGVAVVRLVGRWLWTRLRLVLRAGSGIAWALSCLWAGRRWLRPS